MVIETLDLTKQFNGRGGCHEVNLEVGSGKIFGFLGPNGAGKSTLVKTLVGLLHPTSGTARVLGKPLWDTSNKQKIGYLPENFKYYDWMSGLDVLRFHAGLYKMARPKARIIAVLDMVGLTGQEKKRVGAYSKGMQQRLGLAAALLPAPDLLFLDEPTSALDPVGRREIREILRSLRREGSTVFLNSHLLSEVEMVCDDAAIINKGRIIAQGSLADLLSVTGAIEAKIGPPSGNLLEILMVRYPSVKLQEGCLSLRVKDREDIPEMVKIIMASGTPLYELRPAANSLEDLFVNLLKGEK
ncbi:MAG: ABC transporter ATP-binding protein [Dethiobacter sp.]|nr:ABC transporter ATP-binding protein [Dethiobacter sp.]MCL5981048.1 ABC transporter ATP-binding protein [Bacillota bacterium]